MKILLGGAALALLVTSGCAPSAPRLFAPTTIDGYCGTRTPLATAIESVVSSVEDRVETFPVPSESEIETTVKKSGGAIAHWKKQVLLLPKVAKELGYDDKFVDLRDAAITDRLAGVDTRRIYLTVVLKDGTHRILPMRAFDVQDICNEGKLSA